MYSYLGPVSNLESGAVQKQALSMDVAVGDAKMDE